MHNTLINLGNPENMSDFESEEEREAEVVVVRTRELKHVGKVLLILLYTECKKESRFPCSKMLTLIRTTIRTPYGSCILNIQSVRWSNERKREPERKKKPTLQRLNSGVVNHTILRSHPSTPVSLTQQ
jgi:hypothetical protein